MGEIENGTDGMRYKKERRVWEGRDIDGLRKGRRQIDEQEIIQRSEKTE